MSFENIPFIHHRFIDINKLPITGGMDDSDEDSTLPDTFEAGPLDTQQPNTPETVQPTTGQLTPNPDFPILPYIEPAPATPATPTTPATQAPQTPQQPPPYPPPQQPPQTPNQPTNDEPPQAPVRRRRQHTTPTTPSTPENPKRQRKYGGMDDSSSMSDDSSDNNSYMSEDTPIPTDPLDLLYPPPLQPPNTPERDQPTMLSYTYHNLPETRARRREEYFEGLNFEGLDLQVLNLEEPNMETSPQTTQQLPQTPNELSNEQPPQAPVVRTRQPTTPLTPENPKRQRRFGGKTLKLKRKKNCCTKKKGGAGKKDRARKRKEEKRQEVLQELATLSIAELIRADLSIIENEPNPDIKLAWVFLLQNIVYYEDYEKTKKFIKQLDNPVEILNWFNTDINDPIYDESRSPLLGQIIIKAYHDDDKFKRLKYIRLFLKYGANPNLYLYEKANVPVYSDAEIVDNETNPKMYKYNYLRLANAIEELLFINSWEFDKVSTNLSTYMPSQLNEDKHFEKAIYCQNITRLLLEYNANIPKLITFKYLQESLNITKITNIGMKFNQMNNCVLILLNLLLYGNENMDVMSMFKQEITLSAGETGLLTGGGIASSHSQDEQDPGVEESKEEEGAILPRKLSDKWVEKLKIIKNNYKSILTEYASDPKRFNSPKDTNGLYKIYIKNAMQNVLYFINAGIDINVFEEDRITVLEELLFIIVKLHAHKKSSTSSSVNDKSTSDDPKTYHKETPRYHKLLAMKHRCLLKNRERGN
tara:strand:- start:7410 stop:9686 length:2277 start_codon:yes stop_codon:yes gene_type:complete